MNLSALSLLHSTVNTYLGKKEEKRLLSVNPPATYPFNVLIYLIIQNRYTHCCRPAMYGMPATRKEHDGRVDVFAGKGEGSTIQGRCVSPLIWIQRHDRLIMRGREGKYILEAAKVFKENNWSLDD